MLANRHLTLEQVQNHKGNIGPSSTSMKISESRALSQFDQAFYVTYLPSRLHLIPINLH